MIPIGWELIVITQFKSLAHSCLVCKLNVSNLFRLCLLALHSNRYFQHWLYIYCWGRCMCLEFWSRIWVEPGVVAAARWVYPVFINWSEVGILLSFFLSFFLSLELSWVLDGWFARIIITDEALLIFWSFVVFFLDETTILKLESGVLELAVVASAPMIFWVCTN